MVDGPFDPASFRCAPMPRKRSYPWWVYFCEALVLFILMVPVYHVIRAPRGDTSSAPIVVASPSIAQRVIGAGLQQDMAPLIQQEQYNQYVIQADARHLTPAPRGRRLAANEHCIGGSIVRVDLVNGVTTYTQEMGGDLPMACPESVFH